MEDGVGEERRKGKKNLRVYVCVHAFVSIWLCVQQELASHTLEDTHKKGLDLVTMDTEG